jgi:hypothetical protein
MAQIWKDANRACRTGGARTTVRKREDRDFVYHLDLDHSHIKSVSPGNELVDPAINTFVSDLNRMCLPHKVGMVYSHFYYSPNPGEICICNKMDTGVLVDRFMKPIESVVGGMCALDMLIVPIFKRTAGVSGHWQLGIVDFKSKAFEFYDTLFQSKRPKVCKEFANNMFPFLTDYFRLKGVRPPNFQSYSHRLNTGASGEPGPSQRDGTSCGAFMLGIAMFRARGWKLALSGSHATKLRELITITIATKADPWANAVKEFKYVPPSVFIEEDESNGVDATDPHWEKMELIRHDRTPLKVIHTIMYNMDVLLMVYSGV